MTEIEVDCDFQWLAEQCEQHVGPRLFYLHNRIGGKGWDVRSMQTRDNGRWVQGCKATFADPRMATYLLLKIK
jgi:hypothetical protein